MIFVLAEAGPQKCGRQTKLKKLETKEEEEGSQLYEIVPASWMEEVTTYYSVFEKSLPSLSNSTRYLLTV